MTGIRLTLAVLSGIRLLFSVCLATACLQEYSSAANFVVTKVADTADGACNADCSLREAVIAANASPGPDTINLPAGTYLLQIAGRLEDGSLTGDLDVRGPLAITGAGRDLTSINAQRLDRVLDLCPGASCPADSNLSITGVRIQGGSLLESTFGAGIRMGPSHLTLSQVSVSDNRCEPASLAEGGGIGGIAAGSLRLESANVTDNRCFGAAGIRTNATLEILDSLVGGNVATGNRGGIFAAAFARIHRSAIVNNVGGETGGVDLNSGGLVSNSTFGGNLGGAAITASGIVTIESTSIDNNISGGIQIFSSTALINVRNSILGDVCVGGVAVSSSGHNIEQDDTCGLNHPTDRINLNPLLMNLANNGGPTPTFALAPDSPAINTGRGCQSVDQRGQPRDDARSVCGKCDVGAFEIQSLPRTCNILAALTDASLILFDVEEDTQIGSIAVTGGVDLAVGSDESRLLIGGSSGASSGFIAEVDLFQRAIVRIHPTPFPVDALAQHPVQPLAYSASRLGVSVGTLMELNLTSGGLRTNTFGPVCNGATALQPHDMLFSAASQKLFSAVTADGFPVGPVAHSPLSLAELSCNNVLSDGPVTLQIITDCVGDFAYALDPSGMNVIEINTASHQVARQFGLPHVSARAAMPRRGDSVYVSSAGSLPQLPIFFTYFRRIDLTSGASELTATNYNFDRAADQIAVTDDERFVVSGYDGAGMGPSALRIWSRATGQSSSKTVTGRLRALLTLSNARVPETVLESGFEVVNAIEHCIAPANTAITEDLHE